MIKFLEAQIATDGLVPLNLPRSRRDEWISEEQQPSVERTMTRNSDPVSSSGFPSLWRGLLRGLFETYRPERHYMRGPGPKWLAKHREA